MTIVAVDSFCRMTCTYCGALGGLAPRPPGPVGAYETAKATRAAFFSCGIAYARDADRLAKAAAKSGARVLVHGDLPDAARTALLDRIAASGGAPVFLVDRREFRWAELHAQARARGLLPEYAVLALRSLPPAEILASVPAGFAGKVSLYFPRRDGYPDFFIADEAVVLLRELRAMMPGLALAPFAAGELAFFDSFSEMDYFVGFLRHGRETPFRRLAWRAWMGGRAWAPLRLFFAFAAFFASIFLDTRRARDAALACASSAYWSGHKGYHSAYLGLNTVFWTGFDAYQWVYWRIFRITRRIFTRIFLLLNALYWSFRSRIYGPAVILYWKLHVRYYVPVEEAFWRVHHHAYETGSFLYWWSYNRVFVPAKRRYWNLYVRYYAPVKAAYWRLHPLVSAALHAIFWQARHYALEAKVAAVKFGWFCYNVYWAVRKWSQRNRVYERLTYPVRKPWYFLSYQWEKRLLRSSS